MKYAVELLVTIFFLFSFLCSSLLPSSVSSLCSFLFPSPHSPFSPPSLFPSIPLFSHPSLYFLPHLPPIRFSPSHISLCLSSVPLFIKLSHACTNQCYPSSNCQSAAVPPFLHSSLLSPHSISPYPRPLHYYSRGNCSSCHGATVAMPLLCLVHEKTCSDW